MPDNPILLVTNAGRGETPACESAFEIGQIVEVAETVEGCGGRKGVVAAIVPPGFPPEWAIADAAGKARPLVVSPTRAVVAYIVGFEGSKTPYLLEEHWLTVIEGATANITWERDSNE